LFFQPAAIHENKGNREKLIIDKTTVNRKDSTHDEKRLYFPFGKEDPCEEDKKTMSNVSIHYTEKKGECGYREKTWVNL